LLQGAGLFHPMTLTTKALLDFAKHTLGSWPPDLDPISILNQAGEHLYSMHAWKFAQGRSTLLSLRGTISGTAATWTASTRTLGLTAAFTNYTFVEGDELEITDEGTGATLGTYEVESRTSANAIVLVDSIASTNQTGIGFTLQPFSIDLPDDTRDIIAIQGSGTGNRAHVTLTSLAEVLQAREDAGPNDAHFYAAISYAGTPPVPILEIAPGAGSNQAGALRLFYRQRWARLSSDSTLIAVPEYIEGLLVQIVRAFARGYVREDNSTLDERLAMIHAGPVFQAARKSDGAIQPYSQTRGGIENWRRGSEVGEWYETTSRISGPS